jgi:hypothetical protein
MNESVRECLKGLVATQGASVFADARRCEAFLRDLCPDSRREANVLSVAVRERIPEDLLNSSRGEPVEFLVERMARRLSDDRALEADAARWSVEAWASVLGLAATTAAPYGTFAGPASSTAIASSAAQSASQVPAIDTSRLQSPVPTRPAPCKARPRKKNFVAEWTKGWHQKVR